MPTFKVGIDHKAGTNNDTFNYFYVNMVCNNKSKLHPILFCKTMLAIIVTYFIAFCNEYIPQIWEYNYPYTFYKYKIYYFEIIGLIVMQFVCSTVVFNTFFRHYFQSKQSKCNYNNFQPDQYKKSNSNNWCKSAWISSFIVNIIICGTILMTLTIFLFNDEYSLNSEPICRRYFNTSKTELQYCEGYLSYEFIFFKFVNWPLSMWLMFFMLSVCHCNCFKYHTDVDRHSIAIAVHHLMI